MGLEGCETLKKELVTLKNSNLNKLTLNYEDENSVIINSTTKSGLLTTQIALDYSIAKAHNRNDDACVCVTNTTNMAISIEDNFQIRKKDYGYLMVETTKQGRFTWVIYFPNHKFPTVFKNNLTNVSNLEKYNLVINLDKILNELCTIDKSFLVICTKKIKLLNKLYGELLKKQHKKRGESIQPEELKYKWNQNRKYGAKINNITWKKLNPALENS